jgi:methylglutamate dehydrogenase subunit D
MFERRSALASALQAGGRDGADGTRRIRLGERRGWSLVQIGAFAGRSAELERAVTPLLGAALPTRLGEAASAGGRRLLKIGPAQFWILRAEGDDLASRLQAAIAPRVGTVTPLSHSRTCILVEGEGARELLAKGIAIDFDSDAFQVGQFAQTGLHHTPILVLRSGEHRYEIFVLRSFALAIWDWLTDAALPLGYEIERAARPERGKAAG